MQSYVGYYENGNFYSNGKIIKIPERKKTVINILDEPAKISTSDPNDRQKSRLESWKRIKEICNTIPPRLDFDEKKELEEYREEKYGRID